MEDGQFGTPREHATFMGITMGYWIFIIALLLGGSAVVMVTKPVFLGFEREIYTNSRQYTDAKDVQLLAWIAEYSELVTEKARLEAQTDVDNTTVIDGIDSQMHFMLGRIHAEAARVSPEALSSTVREFLARHNL